ncbi:MAG: DUF3090 family protein [Acidimicrobiia bacterium]|nr:DUF3090 family protein [Acidimicrobiia bacterium]MDX2468759.1 DUF3090 family protein [Acidimicrobiia bacterium]
MTVDRFAGGAIGEPGNRVFLLEFVVDGEAIAYLIEKFQVGVLAQEAQSLLGEENMIGAGLSIDPGGVHAETPVGFRVGAVQLRLDDDTATLVVISTEEGDPPVAYELSLAQLDGFAREALVAVTGGRPPCPRCGLAMDPDGHNCPRSNGDLSSFRP